MEFHVITNGKLSFSEMLPKVKEFHPFIDFLHIREKEKSSKELYEGIQVFLNEGIPAAKLIINDRVDLAMITGIKRVQLGTQGIPVSAVKSSFPALYAGSSVHSLKEARAAIIGRADMLLYGHVFETDSKKGREPRGLAELCEVAEQSPVPVIAIGGIRPDYVPEILLAGAAGFAVMSGIWDSQDTLKAASDYRSAVGKGGLLI
ncbi:thiamine phosphate synthase [Metabacillus sp. RGM 3146]|uniref:thiamine phosphate synthase n=1 Tax=Metabacillus sp. RGM 3146 TaxID=3401092 RepID=UPI003B991619